MSSTSKKSEHVGTGKEIVVYAAYMALRQN